MNCWENECRLVLEGEKNGWVHALKMFCILMGFICRKFTRFSECSPCGSRKEEINHCSCNWSLLSIFPIDFSLTLHGGNVDRDLSLWGRSSLLLQAFLSFLIHEDVGVGTTTNQSEGFKVIDVECCCQRRKWGWKWEKSYSTEEKDLLRSHF